MNIQTQVTDESIKGLLCTAFEGGSNYWYQIDGYELAEDIQAADFKKGGRFNNGDYWHPFQIIPLVAGCAVRINDMEGGARGLKLNRETIEHGLKAMAEKYPKHFADFVSENEDATTGDVFLQCCLFGEAIYG